MPAGTRPAFVAGPAGRIECMLDLPAEDARGVALVAHPHPLHGGTLGNKVVQTLARAFVELGYVALRPNFRGVGASEGVHDEGRGEVEDLASVLDWARTELRPQQVVLAGFSFGAAMQVQLAPRAAPERMVLVGLAVGRAGAAAVPADTLVIHGENDDTVPLKDVLDWARPLEQAVIVVPGTDHFFHGKLHVLRALVRSNWRR